MEPIRYVEEFARIGADMVTFHLEAARGLVDETIERIHKAGCRAGISIKPATPAEELLPWLEKVEMILIMTVEPGFGGQKYIPFSTEKIRQTRQLLTAHGLDTDIEVDGGITADNIGVVTEAGANVIVAGSSVFGGNIAENVRRLLGQHQ